MDATRRDFLGAAAGAALLGAPAWEPILPARGTVRGRAAQSSAARLRRLARATKGPLLRPPDSQAIVFNRHYAGVRPLAVLQAAGAGDVQAAVQWAARYGVPITARAGGHSYAGYSTRRGGLVVDLRRLNAIAVAGGRGTAQVGGGAHLIDVYAALAARGATIPAGSCPTVGISGLALGGGVGMASRKLGTTSDNVAALDIVTADGRRLTCDADTNEDLFWACRGGGGGNFGIVTRWTFDLTRVSSAAYFNVTWPASQAGAALAAWQAFAPETTPDLYSIFSLGAGRGAAFGQLFGSAAQLRRLIRPLTRVGSPAVTVGSAPYLAVLKRWAGCAGESVAACGRWDPEAFTGGSDYVARRLSSAGRAAAARASRQCTLLLDAYGGALNAVAPGATAFAHRGQLFSIQYYAAGSARARVRRARAIMAPHTSGAAYVNYIDPDLRGWPRAYYGPNLARLRAIKQQVDPDGVFAFAQGL